jgi:cytochrome c553
MRGGRRRLAAAALCAAALCTPPLQAADAVPDTLAQRVIACTVCHGKQGVATNQGYFPRIAGKPQGYLYNQLQNFRAGRRQNAAMTALIDTLSDSYLMEIAGYFASLELPYPPPPPTAADDAQLARGHQLVHDGDAGANPALPACTRCHGAAMTGLAPAVPGLLGLPRDYLMAQLGAWRTGERHAAAPDCMAEVARRLSASDLAAVAGYLSQQPVPRPASAAASVAQALPLRCGSVPR